MSFSGFGSCSVDDVVSRILISHAGKDRPWAEWARWHLEAAGHPTELDSVDWAPGTNFVEAMGRALHRDNPMLVLLSSAYLDPQRFTAGEWTARFAQRRKDPDAKLIPLRIENIDLYGGLWAPIVVPDLFDLPADQAVTVLVEAVRQVVTPAPPGALPAAPPAFPGQRTASAPAVEAGPRPPGSLPTVWNLARPTWVSPAVTACSTACTTRCGAEAGWPCRPCTASAVSGRPSSLWSTPTASPVNTNWPGGSLPNNRS
jgi:hypothetical protein